MSSGIFRQRFRRHHDTRITDASIERPRGAAYSQRWQDKPPRSSSRSTDEAEPVEEVIMKVQTDVKAGGFGLLGITAIVLVDIDLNFGGGCCKSSCYSHKGC
jgi:hypothetical protein